MFSGEADVGHQRMNPVAVQSNLAKELATPLPSNIFNLKQSSCRKYLPYRRGMVDDQRFSSRSALPATRGVS